MSENLSIQDKPMLRVKRTASKGLNILYQFLSRPEIALHKNK